jgi:hypothetical protein
MECWVNSKAVIVFFCRERQYYMLFFEKIARFLAYDVHFRMVDAVDFSDLLTQAPHAFVPYFFLIEGKMSDFGCREFYIQVFIGVLIKNDLFLAPENSVKYAKK